MRYSKNKLKQISKNTREMRELGLKFIAVPIC